MGRVIKTLPRNIFTSYNWEESNGHSWHINLFTKTATAAHTHTHTASSSTTASTHTYPTLAPISPRDEEKITHHTHCSDGRNTDHAIGATMLGSEREVCVCDVVCRSWSGGQSRAVLAPPSPPTNQPACMPPHTPLHTHFSSRTIIYHLASTPSDLSPGT